MLIHLASILATAVLLVSDSADLGNMDQISSSTQFFWDPDFETGALDKDALKDKHVLLVVHGYNNTFDWAIKSINFVNSSIQSMTDSEGKPLYDLVIGYIWPGTDNFLEYEEAVSNADKLKKRVRAHLMDLHEVTPHIDILAHSLGNRVMLEALNFETSSEMPLIENFFAMAPAVNAKAVQKKGNLFQATLNCKNIYVLHSDNDDVLKFAYPLTSGEEALGIESKPHFKKLGSNIQFVDCTNLVKGHGYYFQTGSIYKFIQKVDNLINPLPQQKNLVYLKKDGSVKRIKN
jgi:esterase/lipase superfamily enzyme